MKSKSPVASPTLVGRVTPCAPRLQPAGASFPWHRPPNPQPIQTCRAPSVVGRVTPCAPRLQPAGASFPRRRLPNPQPIQTCRAPSVVGRVTPCAPRLQPAGASFPWHRLPNPQPIQLQFPIPTSPLGKITGEFSRKPLIRPSGFGFLSDFGFRISDFESNPA